MRRLIDANAFAAEIERIYKEHYEQSCYQFIHDFFRAIFRRIRKAPTVDAVEVVHGHWTATDVIIHKAGYGVRYYYHAECKVNPHRLFECENDYCPNCGAKMDGEREDNETD